ncbi:MAG: response regulator [Lachnospiraceae bacterium]|nr:response regulator [Lachnospiraceae bacterium]
MSGPLTVLVIEDDPSSCNSLRDCLVRSEDMEISGIVDNSFDALELVEKSTPDAIILDLELKLGGGNGILFLSQLNGIELTKRPYILVTTNNSSNTTLSSVRSLGADFILSKYERGYCAQYVVEFLQAMKSAIQSKVINVEFTPSVPALPQDTREKVVIRTIHQELEKIEMRPKLLGYKYLTDAIYMVMEGRDGNLLLDIGKKYQKSPASVERAIQNCIGSVWAHSNERVLKQNYTAKVSDRRGMPTIMEFVYYYANKIGDEY